MDKTKNKIIFFIAAVIIVLAALVVLLIFFNNSGRKTVDTEMVTEQYVKAYIDDDIRSQYELLDVSAILKNNDTCEIFAQYKSKPLMSTNYSYYIKNVKKADENTLKKINNVYRRRMEHEKNYNTEISEAERYNIRLRNKSTGKDVFKVNLWLVKIDDEWKICTIYEYDRSIDRCFAADMY